MVTKLEDKLAEALLAYERMHRVECGLDPNNDMRLQDFNEEFQAKKASALEEWRITAGHNG